MSENNTSLWVPTRAAALDQLCRFIPYAGKSYADNRNYDLGMGNHTGVSSLSPWLRHRLITEHEVIAAVRGVHSEKVAEKYIQEVFWRSYWKGWLEMRPGVWHQYQQDLQQCYEDEKLFSQAQSVLREGAGIDCFDYWLRELKETGYLHNHARMWFASIWIFTLELPWQLGADFFLQHLLDGDPASNTLSWRWVAGLQTKGKAYAASAENIARFTNGRFNPAGQLNETIQPLSEAEVFEKDELTDSSLAMPGGRVGLILHEDDLQPYTPEQLRHVNSIVAINSSARLSPGGVSESVVNFRQRCMESAISDAAINVDNIQKLEESQDLSAIVNQLLEWARNGNFDAVVWRYAPVGPAASLLHKVSEALSAHEIPCRTLKSKWDTTVWPHAGKGFFALKKKIPELLAEL